MEKEGSEMMSQSNRNANASSEGNDGDSRVSVHLSDGTVLPAFVVAEGLAVVRARIGANSAVLEIEGIEVEVTAVLEQSEAVQSGPWCGLEFTSFAGISVAGTVPDGIHIALGDSGSKGLDGKPWWCKLFPNARGC
jgi:hypothetical protein